MEGSIVLAGFIGIFVQPPPHHFSRGRGKKKVLTSQLRLVRINGGYVRFAHYLFRVPRSGSANKNEIFDGGVLDRGPIGYDNVWNQVWKIFTVIKNSDAENRQ